MIIVLQVKAPGWTAQGFKEAIAMELERFGEVTVLEVKTEREHNEID